jgi:acetyl-CoA synthetase
MSGTITFGGQAVDLAVVEAALLERPDVVEAVAVGVDDAFLGQALNVWVVTAPGVDASHRLRSELLTVVEARVGARPRSLRFAEQLPHTADGRPARAVIAAMVNGAPLAGLEGADDPALDAVRRAR